MMNALRAPVDWVDTRLDELHRHLCGSCQTKLDEVDENRYHRHPAVLGSSVTETGWKERGVDALKVGGYHTVALIGNAVRFVTYLALSLAFPIGMALGRFGAQQQDLYMVYKRCWKNLTFMVQNVKLIVKHALAATVFTIPIAIYQCCPSRETDDTPSAPGGPPLQRRVRTSL